MLRGLSAGRSRSGAALLASLLLAACGSGGEGDPPPGVPVKVVLSESTAAPPALVDDYCVVFTERPTAEEVANYNSGRVPDVFNHIGRSVRQCMDGTAQTYLSQLPTSTFFKQTLYINMDGTCLPGQSACYYPGNPTIDLVQTVLSLIPAIAERQLNMLVGHEVWHAVVGYFHA